jgi:hypothetical protein
MKQIQVAAGALCRIVDIGVSSTTDIILQHTWKGSSAGKLSQSAQGTVIARLHPPTQSGD